MGSVTSTGKQRKRERGQALVVFALSATAVLAGLSLVLDAGNWFLTRRSLQNVADAAALVGAQRWNRDMQNPAILCSQATQDARQYATKNGIATDPGANQGMWSPNDQNGVRVDCPPATGPNAGRAEYIEVQVAKEVDSLLAGLLGFGKIQVRARAVARCRQMSLEVATLSFDPGDPSTSLSGGSSPLIDGNTYSVGTTHTSGSGDLNVSRNAYSYGGFVEVGSSSVNAADKIGSPYSEPPPLLFDPQFTAPTADPSPGTAWSKGTPDVDGYYHVTPGTYTRISVVSGDKVRFEPGVYHITGNQGVAFAGGAVVESTGPVCFVMDDGAGFSSAGGATVSLSSGPQYNNILIYSNDDSGAAIDITGGASTTFNGTLYAPQGTVKIRGSTTPTVNGQVFGDKIDLAGNVGETAVRYDPNYAANIPGPALVE